jgi:hypothetical protein
MLLKAQHTFHFIQSVRGVVQMNDTVAISAENGEVFHSRLGGVLNFGQWQQMVNLTVIPGSIAISPTERKPANLAVER